MDFKDVTLEAPRGAGDELRNFYMDRLELDAEDRDGGSGLVAVRVGSGILRFSEADPDAAPFYHFAFLVPGDRFEEAQSWLAERAQLLPDPETGNVIFDFDNWSALACYCLDPVGNIVELIAHRGVSETKTQQPFRGSDLVGFSELGLVVPDKAASAAELEQERRLHVWDGEVNHPQRLAFVGERGRTFILSPIGRGWLPTDRPAEMHPLRVVVEGAFGGETELSGTPHCIVGASATESFR
jgi:hypothetical protein